MLTNSFAPFYHNFDERSFHFLNGEEPNELQPQEEVGNEIPPHHEGVLKQNDRTLSESSRFSSYVRANNLKKNSLTEPDPFQRELVSWERTYKRILLNSDDAASAHKVFFTSLKSLENWETEFNQYCSSPLFSSGTLSAARHYLELTFDETRPLKPLNGATLNCVKWFALEKAKESLYQMGDSYQQQDSKYQKYLTRVETCLDKLKESQQSFIPSVIFTLSTVHRAIPYMTSCLSLHGIVNVILQCFKTAIETINKLIQIGSTFNGFKRKREWIKQLQPRLNINTQATNPNSQQPLRLEIDQFLLSLERCQTIEEVKMILKRVKIELDVPKTVQKWEELIKSEKIKEFLSSRYQAYVGKTLFDNSDDLTKLLEKREHEFYQQIMSEMNRFESVFESCKNSVLSFDEIKNLLKQYHINLSLIKSSPQTKEEFLEKLEDSDFRALIVGQWVDYHQTVSQLVTQGAQALLLEKIKTESQLLTQDGIKKFLGLIFIALRTALYFPILKKELERYCNEQDLTIDGLFSFAISYSSGKFYRPSEYSLEGYKLSLYKSWAGFCQLSSSCSDFIKKILLKIQMHLIEKCILGMRETETTEQHYQNLISSSKDYSDNMEVYLNELEEKMRKLQLRDVSLMIQPKAEGIRKGEEEFYDPLQTLSNTLKKANWDCLSPKTRDFFQENMGIALEEESFENKIKNFFIKKDVDFFSSYQKNQADFLSI